MFNLSSIISTLKKIINFEYNFVTFPNLYINEEAIIVHNLSYIGKGYGPQNTIRKQLAIFICKQFSNKKTI